MKIAVNTRVPNDSLSWSGRKIIDFEVMPRVGEYFALSGSSSWFKVLVVTHCPFKEADCIAEILAIQSDQTKSIHEAFSQYMQDE